VGWDRPAPCSFRVVTYDRRGHSLSARPTAQGIIRDNVADLGELIERFHCTPAHLVGNSFGGSIALRLAAASPKLVRSVNVHDPPLHGLLDDHGIGTSFRLRERAVLDLLEKGQMETGARRFCETVVGREWNQLPAVRREAWIHNAQTWLDKQRDPEWLTLDVSSLITSSMPVLLTQGDASDPSFAHIVERLECALPRAQRRTLPRAGHVPQATHPDEYAQLIEEFIRQATSTGA
jgi:pimeloyl-ACP methyl ester carboxylesterase